MRILVTGATGFIGRHAVRALAADGNEVVSLSRGPSGPPEASRHISHDLGRAARLPIVAPLDTIVHLAGEGNVEQGRRDPSWIAEVNAQGTLRTLDLARRTGAALILASSQRVYQPGPAPVGEEAPTRPLDPYGYTKLVAELYVQMAGWLFGVRGIILRFFSVYGPGQVITSGTSGVVAIFGQRALADAPLVVMSRQRKDFVEVSDAVQAIQTALERATAPPRPYNIGTGRPTTVLQLAKAVRQAAQSASPIIEDYAEGDPGGLVANIDLARAELGYQPRITLKEGLRRYVDWLRATGPHPA